MARKFYFKQFSLAWVHSLSKTFLFQAVLFSQIVLIQLSISIDILYTELEVKTVLYQTIQFTVSTVSMSKHFHFKQFGLA